MRKFLALLFFLVTSPALAQQGLVSQAISPGNLSGLGAGVATALGVNVGSAGAFVVFNGALGTPSSGTLTNATGYPASALAGTTLAASVVTSSLTTVGAITTGVWNAGAVTSSSTVKAASASGILLDTAVALNAVGGYTRLYSPAGTYGLATSGTITFLGGDTVNITNSALSTYATFTPTTFAVTLAASAQANAACFNSGTTALTYNSGVVTCLASSERYKNVGLVVDPTIALKTVLALQPKWTTYRKEMRLGDAEHLSLLAEDVEKVFPHIVRYDKDGKIHTYEVTEIPILTIAAIQVLEARVRSLEAQLNLKEASLQ